MFRNIRRRLTKLKIAFSDDDHCEMSPDQKAIKAIRILQILDVNVRHAYEIKAYFCRAAYNNDVINYFDQTPAAPGYNKITVSLYYELIMTVVRIFDKLPRTMQSDNTASLPELMSLLRDNNTIEALKENERSARTLPPDIINDQEKLDPGFSSRHKIEVQESVNHLSEAVAQLIDDYKRLSGSHYLRGLRNIRNQLLAHTAIKINDKEVTHYGDAESLLDLTANYIMRLNAAIRRINDNYDQHVDSCATSANYYWQMVITKQI